MSKPYLTSRMMLWSDWILSKDTGAAGYPKQSVYTKLVHVRGGVGYSPDFDSDARETDQFMTRLQRDDKQLFDIASQAFCIKWVDVGNGVRKAVYTNLCTQTAIAQVSGVSQFTISTRLDSFYTKLLDFYHDNS